MIYHKILQTVTVKKMLEHPVNLEVKTERSSVVLFVTFWPDYPPVLIFWCQFQNCFNVMCNYNMSCLMRKPDFCLCENKTADQLSSNCKADQHLCFCYTDSTIPLLPKS